MFIAGADLYRDIVRDHTQSLILSHSLCEAHLDIGKMPVFRGPAVSMIDDNMAARYCGDLPGGGGGHPKI